MLLIAEDTAEVAVDAAGVIAVGIVADAPGAVGTVPR